MDRSGHFELEIKWNSIRKNIASYNVTIDTDKIFEQPLGAEHWKKNKTKNSWNAWHTHLCCCEARCSSCGNFMFSVLLSRGVRLHAFKLTLWGVAGKYKMWSPANKAKSRLAQVEISYSTGDGLLKLYFTRQNVDHSCHPNSHLYSTVQLTKHLLIIDHPKHIVSGKRFAKTIVFPGAMSMAGLVLQPEAHSSR